MKKSVVYELVEEDVQIVSEQILGRRLVPKEISEIKDGIAEKINWFEAIESAINKRISENKKFD